METSLSLTSAEGTRLVAVCHGCLTTQSTGTRDEAQTLHSKFSRILIQDKHRNFFISPTTVLIYIKSDALPLYILWGEKKTVMQAVF